MSINITGMLFLLLLLPVSFTILNITINCTTRFLPLLLLCLSMLLPVLLLSHHSSMIITTMININNGPCRVTVPLIGTGGGGLYQCLLKGFVQSSGSVGSDLRHNLNSAAQHLSHDYHPATSPLFKRDPQAFLSELLWHQLLWFRVRRKF